MHHCSFVFDDAFRLSMGNKHFSHHYSNYRMPRKWIWRIYVIWAERVSHLKQELLTLSDHISYPLFQFCSCCFCFSVLCVFLFNYQCSCSLPANVSYYSPFCFDFNLSHSVKCSCWKNNMYQIASVFFLVTSNG